MFRVGGTFSRLLATLNVKALEATLMQNDELSPQYCEIKDISGGCGSFIDVKVESFKFQGKSILEQHRMVQKALGDEIPKLHGLTIHTEVPKDPQLAWHRPESK